MGLIFGSGDGERTLFFRAFIFMGWFLGAFIFAQMLTPGILGMIGGVKLLISQHPVTFEQAFRVGYESRLRLSANYRDLIFYSQLFFSGTLVSIFALFGRLPLVGKYE